MTDVTQTLSNILHTPLGVIVLIIGAVFLLSAVHGRFKKAMREGDENYINRLKKIQTAVSIILMGVVAVSVYLGTQPQDNKSVPPQKPQKSFEEVYLDFSKSGRPISVTIGSNTNDPNKNVLPDLNLSDKTVYYYSGDLVIESKNDFVSVRGWSADILVSGNLYINSNLRYENKETGAYPRFIVKWDVFISGNVTETVGLIVSYGTLYTGLSSKKWTHSGQIVPKDIKHERSIGTGATE